MKIIGHRGARGTELENSLAAITAALKLDLDAVEFDIHRTSDNVLVVMHDATTKRTANEDIRIAEVTYETLQGLQLQNGQAIPTLESILQIAGDASLYIDVKDSGCVPLLVKLLESYPKPQVTVVSRLPEELRQLRELRPGTPRYLYFLKAEHPWPRPIHMVTAALDAQATGLALDKLLLNPLTYWLASLRGLHMYSYAYKTLRAVRWLHRLYPALDFMTSRPDKINRRTLRT